MQDLVSIIVPVYNVAQYLDRCVTSLTGQTYKNIEIILVDDGSTDTSGALCDLWQTRDNRIKAFHKTNGGLSDARNFGLEKATGRYVCFTDSDDWLDLRFVEVMLGALQDTDSDIAECDSVHTEEAEPSQEARPIPSQPAIFEGKDCFLRFLTTDFIVSVCNKLYRREVLGDLLFVKGVYHEDEYWTYKVFSKARRACRLNYTGYFYYQRPGSIVHTMPSRKRVTDAFTAARERIDFIRAHYPEYASVGYAKMMYTCMFLYNEVRTSDIPEKIELQEEIAGYFRGIWKQYLKKKQYRKEMWRFLFFSLLPDPYCRRFF